MERVFAVLMSIIVLIAFAARGVADELEKVSVDKAEKIRPFNDKDLYASFQMFEINQRASAAAGLSLGFADSLAPKEMDDVGHGRFVEFLKLAQRMGLATRISQPQLALISGYTSSFEADVAYGKHFKLQVSPYIQDGVGTMDLFVELDIPVSLTATNAFARRTRTVAQSFECKVGKAYHYQNRILEDRQSGTSYLFLIKLEKSKAAEEVPTYSMQVKLYEPAEKSKGSIIDATHIKLFKHFDGRRDRIIHESTLQIAQDQPLETISGGSLGRSPMQVDFGTSIKALVTKPADGLIPLKLDLDLSNAFDDPRDHNTLKARGRTITLSTQLTLNDKKTIKIDDTTWCELKIERSSGMPSW